MHNKRINELADKFLYSGRCLRAQTIFNHAEGDSHASTLDHPSLTDFNLLTSSMICFYLETMSLYSDVITKTSQQWHHVVVAKISSEFLSLRAAEKVARDGYPWLAVPMLRNSHDRVVILSSCLQEPENFPIAVGIAHGNRCPDRAKQMRKSYEQTTAARMTGRESGLSKECRSYMQKVDRRYDEETHPALLSFAQRITAWQSGGGLPVVPEFDPVGFAMFMTRHCEVS